jgi:hypothetical protein
MPEKFTGDPWVGAVDEVHRRAADETGHEQVGRVVVEVAGAVDLLEVRLVPGDLAQHRHPVAHRHGLGLVVGDVERGGAETLLEQPDLGPHLHPQLGVEVGQRLVHEEGGRLAHDGAAHGHPLALTTGEGSRAPVEVIGDLEDLGRLLDPVVDLLVGHLPQLEAEGHVVVHRHVRIQGVVLEHHGDVAILGRDVVDHPLADLELPVGHLFEPRHHAQQRRLTAPGRSHQDDELAIIDLDADVGYRPGSRPDRPCRHFQR